jgi:hypothetical protein
MKPRIVSATRLSVGKAVLPASHFIDFRPGVDRVVRDGSRCVIRDGQGLLQDVEVQHDGLSDAQRIVLESTPGPLIGMKFQAVRACAYMSEEGKAERCSALQRAWNKAFGGATFVVAA